MKDWVPLSERRVLAATPVTVNGERGRVGGVSDARIAVVTRLSDGASWEWAWPTVRRIVRHRGADFRP